MFAMFHRQLAGPRTALPDFTTAANCLKRARSDEDGGCVTGEIGVTSRVGRQIVGTAGSKKCRKLERRSVGSKAAEDDASRLQ